MIGIGIKISGVIEIKLRIDIKVELRIGIGTKES